MWECVGTGRMLHTTNGMTAWQFIQTHVHRLSHCICSTTDTLRVARAFHHAGSHALKVRCFKFASSSWPRHYHCSIVSHGDTYTPYGLGVAIRNIRRMLGIQHSLVLGDTQSAPRQASPAPLATHPPLSLLGCIHQGHTHTWSGMQMEGHTEQLQATSHALLPLGNPR